MAGNRHKWGAALSAIGSAMATNNFGNVGRDMDADLAGRADRTANLQQQELAAKQSNMAAQYLQKMGAPQQFVDMANSGAGKQAFSMWGAHQKAQQPTTRKMVKTADGRQRYADDGSLAFPDVTPKQVDGISIGPDGQLVVSGRQDKKNQANSILSNQESAASSTKLLDAIKAMRGAVDNSGYTGPGGGVYDTVDNVMESVLPFSLPGNSGARAIVKSGGMKFVLDQVQDTKGAISNKEMDLFAAAAPGLSQTKEGNRVLLDIAEAVAKRQQQRTFEMENWRRQRGTLEGFEQTWGQYVETNPIVTNEIFKGSAGNPAPVSGQTQSGLKWSVE
ncbi:MAG: hypothetical protein COA78_17240 [Blastopirellula sp.]|nr:MAG: hypothetical protein COA78_17240 [Blastopirellula sp.]